MLGETAHIDTYRLCDRSGVDGSMAGAALDSNLLSGGGTDDTALLQSILNQASQGKPVRLILDGPALVRGLEVYGNTSIECLPGGGLYLKDGSARSLIRNAHRSRGRISDEHISIRGCFLNGNRKHQVGKRAPSEGLEPGMQEDDGTLITGVQFAGVNDLVLEHVTLQNIRAFAIWISNASRVSLMDLTIDCGLSPDTNQDGVHFNGPARFITIRGVKVKAWDDAIAFNANDGAVDDMTRNDTDGPYVGQGPIMDVSVSDVVLMDSMYGFRLLSSDQRADRIIISNVSGVVRGKAAIISHFINPAKGDFGSITFSNINVDTSDDSYRDELAAFEKENPTQYAKSRLELGRSLFTLNSPIENLRLEHISTKVSNDRPLIWVGPDTRIDLMTLSLAAYDPELKAVPLQLEPGAHIQSLDLALQWWGARSGCTKKSIVAPDGAIEELRGTEANTLPASGCKHS